MYAHAIVTKVTGELLMYQGTDKIQTKLLKSCIRMCMYVATYIYTNVDQ